jgi:hypothetical protein
LVNAIVSSPPVHHICVDQHGNLRLLSESTNGECKSSEQAIEVPTNERVLAAEFSITSISSALGDLEQSAAAIPALQSDLLAMSTEQTAMTTSIAALLARIEALEQGVPPIPNAPPTPTPIVNLETAVFGVLGPTGSVMPLTTTGLESAMASLRGTQAPASTFTWNGLPFDVPSVTTGTVPIVTFNGSDEFASTPDATYWTPGDGTSDHAFSAGAWIRIDGTSSTRTILGKYGAGSREWLLRVQPNGALRLVLSDKSKGFNVVRTTGASLSVGQWLHVVAVYDADNPGWTGPTAMEYAALYVNDVAVSSTGFNNPGYEAVEDFNSPVTLGAYLSGNFFKGDMAGGQLGPFVTHAALDAGQVSDLYQIGQAALGP